MTRILVVAMFVTVLSLAIANGSDVCPSDYPCADGKQCCTTEKNSYGKHMNCGRTCQTPYHGMFCSDNIACSAGGQGGYSTGPYGKNGK